MAYPGDGNDRNFYRFSPSESEKQTRHNFANQTNMIGDTSGTATAHHKNNALHSNGKTSIWTTNASKSSSKSNFTSGSNDFHYIQASDIHTKGSPVQNGSTAKLLPYDDQSNSQSKCSMFRGVILCLCLNITYANVVRFPRELNQHGIAFLFPYLLLLLFVGVPIVLLEIALGQFLGQGSAHAWRASPILRGASIVGRLASWLAAITISLHAVLAMVYTGEILMKSVPFNQCEDPNTQAVLSGQECMEQTFLTPVWEHTLYFALLSMSLIALWTLAAACTYSGKTLRRSIILIGLAALVLLTFQTGWEVTKVFNDKKDVQITVSAITFEDIVPLDNNIWFAALVQVLFSTNIGIGLLPVITGKFVYKGDAVRTSLVYISFNVLIVVLSTVFFMTQFTNSVTLNSTVIVAELKSFTSIYDNALDNADAEEGALMAGLTYTMIVIVSIITIAVQIYTASRLIRRHPNYVMSLTALIVAITVLMCPRYMVPRIFDTRLVATFTICALIFDIISISWVYGVKNVYTDLEFSIGRPISKLWAFLWVIAPITLSSLLIWWCVSDASHDLGALYVPRWLPIAISMSIIAFLAFSEVYKQVDYNCCNMIREAGVSSKDWGPADPIVRHAWKQWTSVCEDTGQKDFTLRRRGTRDYTHSIKRGQCSYKPSNSTYATANAYMIKTSTPGRNSPKYNGSIFGDSAIEEDISIGNYPQYSAHTQRMMNDGIDTSSDGRKMVIRLQPQNQMQEKQRIYIHSGQPTTLERDKVRNGCAVTARTPDYSTRTLIKTGMRHSAIDPHVATSHDPDAYGSLRRAQNASVFPSYLDSNGSEHICWRKYATNAEEYSTEL